MHFADAAARHCRGMGPLAHARIARAVRHARRRRCPAAPAPTAASTASAAACPCATAAAEETPITTSANCWPPAWRIRSRRRSTPGPARRSRHARPPRHRAGARSIEHVDVAAISRAAASRTSAATKSAAIGVAARMAGAREQQTDEHRDRAGKIAGEVQRVRRRAPRCGSAATRATRRPCGSRRSRSRPRGRRTHTTPRARLCVMPVEPLDRAKADEDAREREEGGLGERRECSALPCPYWWLRPPGAPRRRARRT